MTVNVADVVQMIKDLFRSFEWNPFNTYPFMFARGFEFLLSFILVMALFQFIVKIKRSLFW